MNIIKFIYFDLGGVFFHWRSGLKILAERFAKTYEEFEGVRIKYDDLTCKGKMTTEELWEKYETELNLTVPEGFNFAFEWVKTFTKIPESHELVKEVIQKYSVGVLTNVYPEIYDLQIKAGLVPDLKYQKIIRSDQLGLVKPDQEIYKIATQKAGVKPEEIFYVDDLEINIKAAKKMGWQAIWFDENDPEESINEIKKTLI